MRAEDESRAAQFDGIRLPPDASRAMLNVTIALWLIGLVLAIAANSDSGASMLVRTIKGRLFSPWMTPPWLDLGFDYRLTYGAVEDANHAIELRRFGAATGAFVNWPGSLRGERAARWRRLAHAIARDADDADREGLLAAALGRGAFARVGSEDVTMRIVRTPPRDLGGPAATAVPAYTARVRMSGGELQLVKQEQPGEVAPLVPSQPEGK